MKHITHICIVTAAVLAGCVDPFALPKLDSKSILVVDGLITTDPGPHLVSLSMSLSLESPTMESVPVTGSTLTIADDLGEVTPLFEIQDGVYQVFPENWQAQVDRSYKLSVILGDGRQYESEIQKVYPPGRIDTLIATYAANSINQDDPSKPQNSFIVTLDATGDPGFPNLFRWRWKSTYEIYTNPELRTTVDLNDPGLNRIPDPPPCSGYNLAMEQVSQCTCCNCWVNEYSTQALVSNNEFSSATNFRGVELTRIPVDGFRFYTKYHIEVEQLSLDESSYMFWKLIQAQQAGADNIFQPNVARIKGNLRNIADPSDEVLGVVSFASVTRKAIFIWQSEIQGPTPVPPIFIGECYNYDETSTLQKPPFW